MLDQCKYSELKNGCVSPSDNDSCEEQGMNSIGCNLNYLCSWVENKCQCNRLLELKKDCSKIDNYMACEYKSQCYFDIGDFSSLIDGNLLKIQNIGTCKEKTCSMRSYDDCEGEIVYGHICYMNNVGECQSARDCSDIINAVKQCSNYSIQDSSCTQKEDITTIIQCEQQKQCEFMNEMSCAKNQHQCIQISGQCQSKQCINYTNKNDCLKSNCNWRTSKPKCQEQMNCETFKLQVDCISSSFESQKCGWFSKLEGDFCTSGCRYLPQMFVNCEGTQINDNVCVKYKNVCAQCEEITEACLCLELPDYCSYDIYRNKCSSKSCKSLNKETCLTSRCFFDLQRDTCFTECKFRYNSYECKLFDHCVWEPDQRQCLKREIDDPQVVTEEDPVRSMNSSIIGFLILSHIIL